MQSRSKKAGFWCTETCLFALLAAYWNILYTWSVSSGSKRLSGFLLGGTGRRFLYTIRIYSSGVRKISPSLHPFTLRVHEQEIRCCGHWHAVFTEEGFTQACHCISVFHWLLQQWEGRRLINRDCQNRKATMVMESAWGFERGAHLQNNILALKSFRMD